MGLDLPDDTGTAENQGEPQEREDPVAAHERKATERDEQRREHNERRLSTMQGGEKSKESETEQE